SRPPTPQGVATRVADHGVTLFFCIPTFYAALLASDIADNTFASVRFGVSAAEALPAETFERFRDRFGVTILDGIGSTEQLHIYLSNTPASTKPGTSGKAVPGYKVRVVDDAGNDQPIDVPGQLLVRGPSVASGYWCRSEMSRATFEGEWMRTGDLYARDADGFHTYLGRVDDMLRVGGEWVSPAEVEATLIEHASVLEAAIVGQADDQGVMRPVAFVVAAASSSASAEDLIEHCRERLAGYKRPKRYEFVDALPKTATGKIQRFKLR
ncbi:MAG: AMP-binding protein, partial [Ilumatobacter sp.]|nr:AMP-binding protein [Ilumatobacter sp.]